MNVDQPLPLPLCRLKGLSPEDVLIYQHIATAGNLGALQLPCSCSYKRSVKTIADWKMSVCRYMDEGPEAQDKPAEPSGELLSWH